MGFPFDDSWDGSESPDRRFLFSDGMSRVPNMQLISKEEENSMFKIEISNTGKGTRSHILASCKVKLTSEDGAEFVSIFDARIMRNRNGQLWVAWPSQFIRQLDQSERYVPILAFSDKLERRIADVVLATYESYCLEQLLDGDVQRNASLRPGVFRGR